MLAMLVKSMADEFYYVQILDTVHFACLSELILVALQNEQKLVFSYIINLKNSKAKLLFKFKFNIYTVFYSSQKRQCSMI